MTWQPVKLLGFAPDLPQDMPGVFVASSGVVPTERGFGNAPNTSPLYGPMNTYAAGGAVLTKSDDSIRIFGGTATKLYEVLNPDAVPSMVDRSGSAYHASNTSTWAFGVMGAASLAINKGDSLQVSTAGAFSTVAAAPKASILLTPTYNGKTWAMLCDYLDGSTDIPHGVIWSAVEDYTDWNADIASECGANILTDSPGRITAGIIYHEGVILLKRRGVYLGAYAGPPGTWGFTCISDSIGCIGKNAICAAGEAVYWCGDDGIWVFDGSYPHRMPLVSGWWTRIVRSGIVRNFVRLTYDPARNQLWLSYGADGTGSPAQYVVYNMLSQTWAQVGSLSNDGQYVAGDLISPTYALGCTSSPYFLTVERDASAGPAASITLGAIGSEGMMTTALGRIRPHWLARSSSTGLVGGTMWSGPTLTAVQTNTRALTERDDGLGLDFDNVEDRYLQPVLTVAAGKTWEMDRLAIDLSAVEDGN